MSDLTQDTASSQQGLKCDCYNEGEDDDDDDDNDDDDDDDGGPWGHVDDVDDYCKYLNFDDGNKVDFEYDDENEDDDDDEEEERKE